VVIDTLGADSTLDTQLIAAKKTSTITKAYIKTSGDPSFVTSLTPPARRKTYYSPTHVHLFDDFAKNIAAADVKNISTLVIDTSWFKLPAVEAGWADDKNQVGQIGAFNVDEGFTGNALAPSVTVNTANALKSSLATHGVTVGSITTGQIPDSLKDSSPIASTSSEKVSVLVSDMLKTSDNVYAEELLAAAIHREGNAVTKDNRQEFLTGRLTKLGLDEKNYVFINASGYSHSARATCDLENDILSLMKKKGIDLAAMSSVAGKEGTLLERFGSIDEKITAKTGTLDGTTALTGDLGNNIQFSFLANGNFSDAAGHSYQDAVVNALAQYPYVTSPHFIQ
jgi:D-alanyl-D-alanine carboxypeptidase/D-alanyl-D-alanine-endopeptidase (penicillin-binding protein 4)